MKAELTIRPHRYLLPGFIAVELKGKTIWFGPAKELPQGLGFDTLHVHPLLYEAVYTRSVERGINTSNLSFKGVQTP